MELELTERSQQLLELLMTIPPQLDIANEYLETNQLTADEITRVEGVVQGMRYGFTVVCFVSDRTAVYAGKRRMILHIIDFQIQD